LTATSGNGEVGLSWTAPATDGGSAVTGYVVEQSTDGGVTWTTAIANTGSIGTTATVTGLTNGTTYAFRVTAINPAGNGVASSTATATPGTTSTAPTAVTVTAGDQLLNVSWTAPASTGGAAISGYRVQVSADAGVNWTTAIANTSSAGTSATVGGLTNGVAYQVRVAAITVNGVGADSTSGSGVPRGVPSAPTGLGATSGDGQVDLAWTAPASDGGSAITGYRVEQSGDGGVTWTTAIADTASIATTATVSGLSNGSAYSFRVSAINVAGVGAASTVASATPATTAAAPTALAATAGDTSVSLNWTAPANTGGSTITGYLVEMSADAGVTWSTAVANTATSVPGATVTGLTNGTVYEFRVSAITGAGTGTASTVASATPFGVPSVPLSVVVTAGVGELAVSWSAPASNGGSAVTGFQVSTSVDGGVTWVAGPTVAGSATSATVSGLTNGVEYLVRVDALNAGGAGPWSAGVAGTPRTTASAPSALTATSGEVYLTLRDVSRGFSDHIRGWLAGCVW
jgi:titin